MITAILFTDTYGIHIEMPERARQEEALVNSFPWSHYRASQVSKEGGCKKHMLCSGTIHRRQPQYQGKGSTLCYTRRRQRDL